MLLSNEDIKRAMKDGEILIENFSEGCLEPASYDMRMGNEAVTETGKINVQEKGILMLNPGDLAVLGTYEILTLSTKYAGHIGLRSHYTRKGLVLLTGPQIDPGYNGILTIAVCNLGPGTITIPYMERFITVEFFKLIKEASKPYAGPFKGQRTIPTADIEFILSAKGISISGVINELRTLSRTVSELKGSIDTMKWLIPLLAGIVSGLISLLAVVLK